MKLFGRYLGYRLKKTAIRSFVMSIFSVMITEWVVSISIKRTLNYVSCSAGLYILAIVLGCACTLIPMLELSEFKNRRNLDTLYFFPIKREKMALVHFLSGFIQVIIIYTVAFISAYATLALNTTVFALEYMPLYYLFSVLIGFVMYSIFAFLFSQGNTVADGVIFCLLWICLLFFGGLIVINEVLIDLLKIDFFQNSQYIAVDWGFIYSPINNLTVIFKRIIEAYDAYLLGYLPMNLERYIRDAYMFFVWGGIGIAAAVGYFMTFVKKGAEKAGEISNSWFGYRLLIPLYGYGFMLFGSASLLLDIMLIISMVIGYVIYRRGFKFKPSDFAVIFCSMFAAIIGPIM